MNVRISMTERLAVEANGARLDEQRFPGRQGRILFAYLVAQKGRRVPRDELAQVLWGDELPATWENALRVLMTKLRALLDESGIDGSTALTSAYGCYQLTLPDGAWVDIDAATDAVARGEAALADGNLDEARAQASAAVELARRSFLPGEDGIWVEEKRRELHLLLVQALECLRDASFAAGEFADSVCHSQEVTELEPFRESGYRRLMEVHAAAGNPAEALRVYERCRRFLADELGAYPSAETEAVYLELLRSSPTTSLVGAAHLPEAVHGPKAGPPPRRRHRRLVAGGACVLLVVVAAAAIATTLGGTPPPEVLRTSLVRLDPKTLRPTKVVPIRPRADLVVAAGGYLWVTHGILRYTEGGIRNAGDRALTRVEPATEEAVIVGGGVAPCGMTPDPSGDLWVLNCFASGQDANVQRIDARTLEFKATWKIKDGGFIRGMTYGGGSLWLTDSRPGARRVIKLNPRNGRQHPIQLPRKANWLTWSEGYGDLWISNFGEGVRGSVLRMHAETERVTPYDAVEGPAYLLVEGDSVWVADWDNPDVARLPAFGSEPLRHFRLKVRASPAGVVNLAAGYGAIWATVPDDHGVWRIDQETGEKTRIPLRYYPWGVTLADDGIWVSLRAHDA